ncbi:hypothetical protein BYT27DRAFT_7239433 [Phlegmacium glaucopus]|nr:hypothetical protein BYT27DRAFT_7239433 [Phlegmacium glaucopus]
MAKRHKLSNLTDQETATVVNLLKRFQLELDEDDEDGQEVVHALQTVVRKFSKLKEFCTLPHAMLTTKRVLKACSLLRCDATVLTLTQANIKVKVLEWNSNGRSQGQHLGGKTMPNVLSLDKTTKQIGYIRKHIAFKTEAGCQILINAIMLHAVTNLDTSATGVAIAPEFHIPYMALDSGGSSYAGAVDYLMALGKPSVRDAIVLSPQLAFTNSKIHQSLTCSIYEAKLEKVLPALPQVVMEAVIHSQCFKYFKLSSLRSVLMHELGLQPSEVASQLNEDGPGGSTSYLPPIHLEHDLSGLPLILGLLYNWPKLQDMFLRLIDSDYLVEFHFDGPLVAASIWPSQKCFEHYEGYGNAITEAEIKLY